MARALTGFFEGMSIAERGAVPCHHNPTDNGHCLSALATTTLRELGPELRGYLSNQLACASDADDVYAQFCEDFWRGLPSFQRRCTMRTWVYVLARNAAARHRRLAANRPEHRHGITREVEESIPASATSLQGPAAELMHLVARLTSTDQELVRLRLGAGMSWREIAERHLDGPVEPAALRREEARLRKAYQVIRQRLRQLAAH